MQATELLRRAIDSVEKNDSQRLRWVKLAGDASMRRYFRVYSEKKSFVLMLTDRFDPKSLPFLRVQNFLMERKVRCPKVEAVDGESGAILLQDLGDALLVNRLAQVRSEAEEKKIYKQAIDLLVDFHTLTSKRRGDLPADVEGFQLAFDEEKLLWEVDFTLDHWNGPHMRRALSDGEKTELRKIFQGISKKIAAEPRVFTHRDFHARNIMVGKGDSLYAIDFQDARMGARQYDLASLLRDSYYRLPDQVVDDLLEYYLRKVERRERIRIPRKHFLEIFDYMSLQRNFKAIGSFCSIFIKRSDPSYLPYVGHTLENMRRVLIRHKELRRLQEILFCGQ